MIVRKRLTCFLSISCFLITSGLLTVLIRVPDDKENKCCFYSKPNCSLTNDDCRCIFKVNNEIKDDSKPITQLLISEQLTIHGFQATGLTFGTIFIVLIRYSDIFPLKIKGYIIIPLIGINTAGSYVARSIILLNEVQKNAKYCTDKHGLDTEGLIIAGILLLLGLFITLYVSVVVSCSSMADCLTCNCQFSRNTRQVAVQNSFMQNQTATTVQVVWNTTVDSDSKNSN